MFAILCACGGGTPLDEVCEDPVRDSEPDVSQCEAGLECVMRNTGFFICSQPCSDLTDCPLGRRCEDDGYCETRKGRI